MVQSSLYSTLKHHASTLPRHGRQGGGWRATMPKPPRGTLHGATAVPWDFLTWENSNLIIPTRSTRNTER